MLQTAATWLLTYALHSFVLGAIALILLPRMRISPALRCVLWRTAMFAPLLTTSIAVASPMPGTSAQTVGIAEPLRRLLPPRWGRVESLVDVRVVDGGRRIRSEKLIDPLATAAAAILLASMLTLAFIGAGVMIIRRRAANRLLRLDDMVRLDLQAISGHDIEVSSSRGIVVPLALPGRRICVPAVGLDSLGASERAAVLLHEVAHVERRDPEWIGAARIVCALSRWQPITSRILNALERDSELAADAHAVRRLGARPDALVAGLAWFASRIRPTPALAGVPFLRHDSPLVQRARGILAPPEPRSRTRDVVAGLGIALTLAVLLALPVAAPAAPVMGQPSPGENTDLNIRKIEYLETRQPVR